MKSVGVKQSVYNSSKTRLFMLFGWDNIHSFAFFPLNSTGLIGCVALHDQINILGLPLPVYSVTENSILYLVYHLISHLYTCLAGAMYLFSIFICCWWCDDGCRGQALKHESTPNLPPSITISIFTVIVLSLYLVCANQAPQHFGNNSHKNK